VSAGAASVGGGAPGCCAPARTKERGNGGVMKAVDYLHCKSVVPRFFQKGK
jgi:hypothetical protein